MLCILNLKLCGLCAKSLQLCPTLCDTMGCSPPGSSVHGILQARNLEWVAMPSSRRSSLPEDRTHVSYVSFIGRRFLYYLCHQVWWYEYNHLWLGWIVRIYYLYLIIYIYLCLCFLFIWSILSLKKEWTATCCGKAGE